MLQTKPSRCRSVVPWKTWSRSASATPSPPPAMSCKMPPATTRPTSQTSPETTRHRTPQDQDKNNETPDTTPPAPTTPGEPAPKVNATQRVLSYTEANSLNPAALT